MKLSAGDWVEVRSKEEILRTLDKNGRLEELPFTPQMFNYCGKRFKVRARAHKTCDTVSNTGGRRLPDGIHLDLRCDGQAYGGCQAACLLFWKHSWLEPVRDGGGAEKVLEGRASGAPAEAVDCTEQDVWEGTHVQGQRPGEEARYICQATQLPNYTTLLHWWDVRQYIEDYTSGNNSLWRLLSGLTYQAYNHGTQAWRNKIGRPARWLYDRVQSLWRGIPYPNKRGRVPDTQRTPTSNLNLQAGDLVRVKSHEEILATIHPGGLNRGLLFDKELVPFCGKTYRVKARLERFIDEKTGEMISLKMPAVLLDDVWCQSRYSECKMFCPRAIYSWWREVWLERVSEIASRSEIVAETLTNEPQHRPVTVSKTAN